MKAWPYYLGCPAWAESSWIGSIFPSRLKKSEMLKTYSSIFNTVEGNSSFYSLPSEEIVKRWVGQAEEGFQFAFKFPRTISHEKALVNVKKELGQFLKILEILKEADRLGPAFLQLSPRFDFNRFEVLKDFIGQLSDEFEYGVEVRHLDYFDEGEKEKKLHDLLIKQNISRVVFDSRVLFSARPKDAYEQRAQKRKPNPPLRKVGIGQKPMVRIVVNNQIEEAETCIKEWASCVGKWIEKGKTPYVFFHAPNEVHAPVLCRKFHQELKILYPKLPSFPSWPIDKERGGTQMQLFSEPQNKDES